MRQITEEERERAATARDLLNNPLLTQAFADVRDEYVQVLVGEPTGTLTAQDAHASMRVLERVRQRLTSYSMDDKVLTRSRGTSN